MDEYWTQVNICSICLRQYTGFGNNAEPVNRGRCCDECNVKTVIPMRMGTHITIKKPGELFREMFALIEHAATLIIDGDTVNGELYLSDNEVELDIQHLYRIVHKAREIMGYADPRNVADCDDLF